MDMKVTTVNADGTVEESVFEMPQDLVDSLERSRAKWRELEEAGTPFWCTHEGREVSDDAAYWWEDHPNDPIYHKHGVRCRDCGGYIQHG